MPRFYCDYCDVFLTHDSFAGRKQHMRGRKHQDNVRQYYMQFLQKPLLTNHFNRKPLVVGRGIMAPNNLVPLQPGQLPRLNVQQPIIQGRAGQNFKPQAFQPQQFQARPAGFQQPMSQPMGRGAPPATFQQQIPQQHVQPAQRGRPSRFDRR